jgi:hypothetical protein
LIPDLTSPSETDTASFSENRKKVRETNFTLGEGGLQAQSSKADFPAYQVTSPVSRYFGFIFNYTLDLDFKQHPSKIQRWYWEL